MIRYLACASLLLLVSPMVVAQNHVVNSGFDTDLALTDFNDHSRGGQRNMLLIGKQYPIAAVNLWAMFCLDYRQGEAA